MNLTRRAFIQNTSLLAAAAPLAGLNLSAASTPTALPPADGILREILFSPGNITEKKSCYDRFEPLQKPAQNPVMTAQMPWKRAA